jgi:three-Cys-motif partner protein
VAKHSASKPDLTVQTDPCPNLIVERGTENLGVGPWVPAEKHRLLCEYLHASRHAWAKWPNRVLIDPFCGPGRIQVRGESATREGGTVLAWRTLATSAPFTKVLVGDIEDERVRACKARLNAASAPVQDFTGPAVRTIHDMVAAVPRGSLCFAYIDPYNLRLLSHSILKALAPPLRVDLAINFSTMDLIRNVDFESGPGRDGFDDVAPGWKEHLARQGTSRSAKWIEFFRYWVELVRNLGFEYSKEMPLIENDTGQGIYRMVFLANHDLPKRIWADVARGPNKSLDLF